MTAKKALEVTPPEASGGAYEPPSLSLTQYAARIGVSTRTVLRLLAAGSIPQPVYFGRRARFRESDAVRVAEYGPSLPGSFEVPASPNRVASKRANVKRLATINRKRREREKLTKKLTKKSARKAGAK